MNKEIIEENKNECPVTYEIVRVWCSGEYAGIDKSKFSASDTLHVSLVEVLDSTKKEINSILDINLEYLGSSGLWVRNKSNQLLLPVNKLKTDNDIETDLNDRFLLVYKDA